MKTLASRVDANEIERRFELVSEQDQRRWGKMTAGEMVCHVRNGYALGLGTLTAEAIKTPIPSRFLKWGVLHLPVPWPKNTQTPPELEFANGAPGPIAFLTDKADLIDTFWRYVDASGGSPNHPIFGPMTRQDWLRLGYLHADHHLRQFGR